MLELMQRLIAFKYSCKLNHWGTNEYAKHLLFDRLQEGIDDFVDNIAEEYFMANNKKSDLKANVMSPNFVNQDLIKSCQEINAHIEKIINDEKFSQGILSLLGNIAEAFDEKLALLTLK